MHPRFLLFLLALAPSLHARPEKPNIILIVADDLGYGDIAPFGSKKNRTPNLDRLAAEGTRLTSFYAAPVCTPSRAQILTGSYAKRVSLPNVLGPAAPVGLSADEPTIASVLKPRGYATIAIGKWHVGDHPDFLPTAHGFDSYFGLPYSNDMGARPGAKRLRPPLPLVKDTGVIETVTDEGQDSLTARYTETAVSFIREHKEQPFLLYLPHTGVHVPLHPGEKFRGKSQNGLYGDWVEELDWSVGRIVDTVHELGLDENTLIVFTSDNGPWLTQGTNGGEAGPLRGGKAGTYEGGVRVPTIARWTGKIPAGKTLDAITANYDFLPTFASLAGATLPANHRIDGSDISPLLLGKTTESPHQAHYYFAGNNLQAVRSGPWKLAVVRQNEATGKPQADAVQPFTPTLYNLETDIGETRDVASANPKIVARLQALIDKEAQDLGLTGSGPGVRPPGRVDHPVGLWLPGKSPSGSEVAADYDTKSLAQLSPGETLSPAQAPQVANKSISVRLTIGPEKPDGIILAHGGTGFGYSLHLREGRLTWTIRNQTQPVTVTTEPLAPGAHAIQADLAKDGALSLTVDGKSAASGKSSPLISRQPAEGFSLGLDSDAPVGDYQDAGPFTGKLSQLEVIAR